MFSKNQIGKLQKLHKIIQLARNQSLSGEKEHLMKILFYTMDKMYVPPEYKEFLPLAIDGIKYSISVTPMERLEQTMNLIEEVIDNYRRYKESQKDKRVAFVFANMMRSVDS